MLFCIALSRVLRLSRFILLPVFSVASFVILGGCFQLTDAWRLSPAGRADAALPLPRRADHFEQAPLSPDRHRPASLRADDC